MFQFQPNSERGNFKMKVTVFLLNIQNVASFEHPWCRSLYTSVYLYSYHAPAAWSMVLEVTKVDLYWSRKTQKTFCLNVRQYYIRKYKWKNNTHNNQVPSGHLFAMRWIWTPPNAYADILVQICPVHAALGIAPVAKKCWIFYYYLFGSFWNTLHVSMHIHAFLLNWSDTGILEVQISTSFRETSSENSQVTFLKTVLPTLKRDKDTVKCLLVFIYPRG